VNGREGREERPYAPPDCRKFLATPLIQTVVCFACCDGGFNAVTTSKANNGLEVSMTRHGLLITCIGRNTLNHSPLSMQSKVQAASCLKTVLINCRLSLT